MNFGDAVRRFMAKNPILGVAAIALVTVSFASGLGWFAPLASFFQRTIGGAWSKVAGSVGLKKVAMLLFVAGALTGGMAFVAFDAAAAEHPAAVAAPVSPLGLAAVAPMFGLRKIFSKSYPVTQVAGSHTPQKIREDIKKYLSSGVLSYAEIRVFGPIVKAGAGPGTATGKENPEGLITDIVVRTSPGRGMTTKNNLSPRGQISHDIFTRGYAVRAADITDAAGTVQVDFSIPLRFKKRGAAVPIEHALPMDLFDSVMVEITCSGRQELFSGGSNTYDLSGLVVELWADVDFNVAHDVPKVFHLSEEFEQAFPVTQSTNDFEIVLPEGYVYKDFLLMAQRDGALVDDIITNISVDSGGRSWLAHGEANATGVSGIPGGIIRKRNRDDYVTDPAEALTGLYYFDAMRDGGYRRAVDAGAQKVRIRMSVQLGGGTVREIILRCNRMVPMALTLPQGAAQAA